MSDYPPRHKHRWTAQEREQLFDEFFRYPNTKWQTILNNHQRTTSAILHKACWEFSSYAYKLITILDFLYEDQYFRYKPNYRRVNQRWIRKYPEYKLLVNHQRLPLKTEEKIAEDEWLSRAYLELLYYWDSEWRKEPISDHCAAVMQLELYS